MRIIVEGPDGSGKTTLIRGLKLTPVVHNGVLKDPFGTYLSEIQCDALMGFDRFYPSEQVYGPIMRGEDMVGSRYRMLDRVLLSQQTVLVICKPPEEVALKNWKVRQAHDDEYVTKEERWLQVYRGYDHIKTHLPTVMFDYTVQSFADCLDLVMSELLPVNQGPGIGNFKPGVTLLIGDRTTHKADHNYPFVHATGCSPWLANILELHEVSEQDLYWVNATDSRGRELDAGFIKMLKPSRVISLGEEAHCWCVDRGVDTFVVHHPQWHKRFKHKYQYQLMSFLVKER